jgi:hypothetical protein
MGTIYEPVKCDMYDVFEQGTVIFLFPLSSPSSFPSDRVEIVV